MNDKNIRQGIILIVIGIMLGLNSFHLLRGEWFIYVLAAGFLGAYFIRRRSVGFLIPGCIFTALAAFSTLDDVIRNLDGLYFLMLLGAAFIAVFLIHTCRLETAGWGERYWPLFPGLSLVLIGGLTLAVQHNIIYFNLRYTEFIVPGFLILIGVVLLVNNIKKTY